MKILLTGATGFLGSYLARRLLREGHEVRALRRPASSLARLGEAASRIRWFEMDQGGGELAASAGADVVVHMAVNYGRRGETAAELSQVNTQAPLRLLETAIGQGVRRFIHTDSALPRATNGYTLSKRHFAEWGEWLATRHGIDFVDVRLQHIYGPGDSVLKFTERVIQACLGNEPELKLMAGTQERDFIFVADAVDALARLLDADSELPSGYCEVPLGTGRTVPIRTLVETIHRLTSSSTRLLFGSIPSRPNEVAHCCADTSMLLRLGWAPKVGLEEGLALTIRETRSS